MKKIVLTAVTITGLLSLFLLTGCLKDTCRKSYKLYKPIYEKLSTVRASMKSAAPRTLSSTGKIYVYGNYIFLNEASKGLHVIDNTDPSRPKNIGFINIPGNVDLAVKGSYLYADCYSDIVVFDISNPVNVKPVHFVNNVFKDKSFWYNTTNPDSVSVITGYAEKDTVMDCATYQQWINCPTCNGGGGLFLASMDKSAAPSGTGKGGSMARFSVVNDYLYGVSISSLYSFDISNPAQPQQTKMKNLGWGIETIYPFKNKLFIGSNSGMFIYDISNPSDPVSQGYFGHFRSCDPVVADDQHAYVTLRSGTACQGFTNQLEVVSLASLNQPTLVKTYSMTNPHGLAKDGNLLFICDGASGLKVYDASNPRDLKLLRTITGTETYDVIAANGLAVVVTKEGLYQYNYSNPADIRLLSVINTAP